MHNRRSRQNAATSCPLRACSEISPRHFWRAFLLRSCCVIGPASPPAGHNATHHLVRTRCASRIAHHGPETRDLEAKKHHGRKISSHSQVACRQSSAGYSTNCKFKAMRTPFTRTWPLSSNSWLVISAFANFCARVFGSKNSIASERSFPSVFDTSGLITEKS